MWFELWKLIVVKGSLVILGWILKIWIDLFVLKKLVLPSLWFNFNLLLFMAEEDPFGISKSKGSFSKKLNLLGKRSPFNGYEFIIDEFKESLSTEDKSSSAFLITLPFGSCHSLVSIANNDLSPLARETDK